jgi:hypothetical protein
MVPICRNKILLRLSDSFELFLDYRVRYIVLARSSLHAIHIEGVYHLFILSGRPHFLADGLVIIWLVFTFFQLF